MTAFYLVCALVGGAMVLMSLLGGDKDSDADADTELEAELGADVDGPDLEHGAGFEKDFAKDAAVDRAGELWLPFLSLRFWTFFLCFMGLCGLLVGWTTEVGELLRGMVAGGTGIVAGTAVAYMMRYFKRSQVHSGVDIQRLVGCEAKVLLPLRAGQEGKVRVSRAGQTIDLIASCDDGETIAIGSDVLIIATEEGRVRVVSSESVLGTGSDSKKLTS